MSDSCLLGASFAGRSTKRERLEEAYLLLEKLMIDRAHATHGSDKNGHFLRASQWNVLLRLWQDLAWENKGWLELLS